MKVGYLEMMYKSPVSVIITYDTLANTVSSEFLHESILRLRGSSSITLFEILSCMAKLNRFASRGKYRRNVVTWKNSM